MDEKMMDWLVKRAEEEGVKVRAKALSWFAFMFASEKKIKENLEELHKSQGRIEMIHEIVEKVKNELLAEQK